MKQTQQLKYDLVIFTMCCIQPPGFSRPRVKFKTQVKMFTFKTNLHSQFNSNISVCG